ncbi:MAG: HAMP domain-containing sensor histidine kinase [Arthrobacter sp.]
MDGTLSQRVALKGPRDEFRDLADSFDAMLERLEAHVAEQRRFAVNASHELRTPLAISQTLLEVARNDPDRDVDALLDRLHAVNVRAIDLTEALLMLSRADQKSSSPANRWTCPCSWTKPPKPCCRSRRNAGSACASSAAWPAPSAPVPCCCS